MHAVAGERVQVGRQRRHQRLALAGAHLGDLAGVQREAADQLHVEMAQPELAARGLAHQREGLGHQGVERGARGEARLQLARLLGELLVGQRARRRVSRALIGRHGAAQLLDQALVTAAENLRQKLPHAGGVLEKLGIVRIDRKGGKSFRPARRRRGDAPLRVKARAS